MGVKTIQPLPVLYPVTGAWQDLCTAPSVTLVSGVENVFRFMWDATATPPETGVNSVFELYSGGTGGTLQTVDLACDHSDGNDIANAATRFWPFYSSNMTQGYGVMNIASNSSIFMMHGEHTGVRTTSTNGYCRSCTGSAICRVPTAAIDTIVFNDGLAIFGCFKVFHLAYRTAY